MNHPNIKKQQILFLIIFLTVSFFSGIYAQAPPFNYNDIISQVGNSGFNIPINDPFTQPMTLNKQPEKFELHINLNFGETYFLGRDNNNLSELSLTLKDNSGITLDTKVLTITQDNPEQLWVYDFSDNPALTSFTIVVNSFFVNTDFSDPTVVRNTVQLKVNYSKKYLIDVKDNSNAMPVVALNELPRATSFSNKTVGRVQDFTWTRPAENPFPAYQIQVLKLYNNNQLNNQDNTINANIDWSKALTLESECIDGITQNMLLSISEGSGFYVWRVRPVGNFYKGGITNSLNWGAWSNAPANGETVTLSLYDLNSAHPQYFYLIDQDENKNWIYSRTFTEGNKIHEQVVYANGLQQAKQTQVRLSFEDDYKLVTQNIIDYSGRPSVVTMPVPIDETGNYNQGYKNNLVKKSSNLYTADEFDTDSKVNTPSTVDENSTDYGYYSKTNADKQIPDAEGYPYSRALYYNDGTGRVKEQATPGKAHMIGDQADMQHTVKTLYSTPAREELLRIFGNEAPDENKVLKVVTIDQNGVASISYIGENGKVIATCISEAVPAGGDINVFDISKTSAHNIESNGNLISSQRISLALDNIPVTIDYTVNCADAPDWGSCTPTPDCGFSAKITVINLSDNSIANENTIGNVCSSAPYTLTTLTAGNYLIIKELFHEVNIAQAAQITAAESEAKIRPIVDLVSGWIQSVYNPDDFIPFFEKVNTYNIRLAAPDANFNSDYNLPSDFTPDASMHSITLVPAYSAGPPAVIPTELVLQSCCGEIRIPFNEEKASKFKCYSTAELVADPSLSPDFSQYLVDIIAGSSITWGDVMPDYTAADFNSMIRHMLTDNYSIAGTDVPCIHYTCEQLWKCWISSVDVLEDMLALESQPGNTTMYQASTGDDTEEGTSGSTHDETFDNNTGGFGGWLMQWFIDKKLSQRMKEDLPPLPSFELNLAENFLECTGYKLRIVVNTSSQTDIYASILDSDSDYNPSTPKIYDNAGTLNVLYMYDPTYAFKYFNYMEGNSLNCEKIFCYTGPTTLGLAGRALCENDNCLDVDVTKWDSLQVLDFYTCIKTEVTSGMQMPVITPILTCTQFEAMTTEFDLFKSQRYALIAECNQTCVNKKTQYITALYDLFEANCYIINPPCPEAGALNIVTTADIDLLADTMVNRCKAYCPSGDIDYCEDLDGCVKFNYITRLYDTYGSGSPFQDIIIRKLTDCEILKKQMVDFWDFELYIPTKCPTEGTPPTVPPDWNTDPVCTDGVPQPADDTDSNIITGSISNQ